MPSTESYSTMSARHSISESNKLASSDRPVHDWYRFVLSYPPHLVRGYLDRFGVEGDDTVLDPFCGTGTTIVECKKRGVTSIGIEAHPFSHFASSVKTDWNRSSANLRKMGRLIADDVLETLDTQGIVDDPQRWILCDAQLPEGLKSLPPEAFKLLLTNSISPLPLHKTLLLRDAIDRLARPSDRPVLYLALARALVTTIGNLHFGPEVGVSAPKEDAAVVAPWLQCLASMADDLETFQGRHTVSSTVHHGDSRYPAKSLLPKSVDFVITSPPYPNEKDYTRTTRLESVILRFISSKQELQALKKGMLLRSNTRNVYKGDLDDLVASGNAEVARLVREIEERRIELGKTSGFEKLYAKVTGLYFGGMAKHLADLRSCLRPGAKLAYVVGDQASFFRVMIRTGQILGQLAEELGYRVESIDLFRTRLATATRDQLREEVVVLHWPG